MKDRDFLKLVLGFILVSGTIIGGTRIFIQTGWESSSDAKAKVVREYFDGFEDVVKEIFQGFD